MEREIIEQELNIERENVVISEFPAEDYYTKVEVDDLLDEKANNEDLEPIYNSISNIQAEQTTQNTNISANTTNITQNTTNIAQNTANITQNTANITQNTTDIATINNNLANYSLKTETGSQIDLSINSSDYKMKAILKDKNGNTIYTSNEIDLPLESVVVNGSYDSLSKEIVLTLQNGNTIRFSVSDLVSGLVNTTTLNTILQDYALNSSIPTNTSDLTNDSGFLNASSFKTINNESIVGSGDITISAESKVVQNIEINASIPFNFSEAKTGIYKVPNYSNLSIFYYKTDNFNIRDLSGLAVKEIVIDKELSKAVANETIGYAYGYYTNNYAYSNGQEVAITLIKDNNGEVVINTSNIMVTNIKSIVGTTQNIDGEKTFLTVPKTTNNARFTSNAHIVNKKYVDESIASAIGTALGGSY